MQGFREGYAFFEKSTGDYTAASYGAEYIDSVNSKIDALVEDLNAFRGFKTDPSKLQGDVAEFWHADSFNINATLKGSKHRAFVDRSHAVGSPDI